MKRAAFVTGGASGIGLSICEHLARAGHSVAVADYNGDGAEDAAKAIRDGGGRRSPFRSTSATGPRSTRRSRPPAASSGRSGSW